MLSVLTSWGFTNEIPFGVVNEDTYRNANPSTNWSNGIHMCLCDGIDMFVLCVNVKRWTDVSITKHEWTVFIML